MRRAQFSLFMKFAMRSPRQQKESGGHSSTSTACRRQARLNLTLHIRESTPLHFQHINYAGRAASGSCTVQRKSPRSYAAADRKKQSAAEPKISTAHGHLRSASKNTSSQNKIPRWRGALQNRRSTPPTSSQSSVQFRPAR